MKDRGLIKSLMLGNAAVFLLVSTFLPKAGSFSWSGPVDRIVASRTEWGLAFGATLASAVFSWGIYVFVTSRPGNSE